MKIHLLPDKRLYFRLVWMALFVSIGVEVDGQILLQGSFNERSSGLADIITVQKGANSLGNNVAGLVSLDGFAANAFLSQRFLSKDLNIISLSAGVPTSSGSFGITVRHLGFDLWREQMVGIGYARQLGKRLNFGGQIDFYHLDLKEYGQQSTFTFELGIQVEVSPSVSVGLHTVNPILAGLNEEDILPAFLAIGVAYEINKSLDLLAEIQQSLQGNTGLKFALAYRIIEDLEAHLGYQSLASRFSFGLRYASPYKLTFGMSMNYHQVLGLSPSFGITYQNN